MGCGSSQAAQVVAVEQAPLSERYNNQKHSQNEVRESTPTPYHPPPKVTPRLGSPHPVPSATNVRPGSSGQRSLRPLSSRSRKPSIQLMRQASIISEENSIDSESKHDCDDVLSQNVLNSRPISRWSQRLRPSSAQVCHENDGAIILLESKTQRSSSLPFLLDDIISPPKPGSRQSLSKRRINSRRMGATNGDNTDKTDTPDNMDYVETNSVLSAYAGHVTEEALNKVVGKLAVETNVDQVYENGNIILVPADHISLVSRQDIWTHNALEHVATSEGWWAVQKGKVYNCKTLAHIFNARLEEISHTKEQDDTKMLEESASALKPFRAGWFNRYMSERSPTSCLKHGLIFLYLRLCGIPRHELETQKHKAHIADVVSFSEEELRCEIVSTLDNVKQDLDQEMDTPITENKVDFLNLIQREQRACADRLSRTKGYINGGDPNYLTFELPEGIEPEEIRAWADDWVPFDFTVEPWFSYPENKVDLGDTHECFTSEVLRPWLNDWHEFDMEVDGEVGWSVLKEDIIKNDEPTEEQLVLIKTRETRTDLLDTTRMERRRDAIAEYFVKKYDWDHSKVEPFMTFSKNLEENKKALVKLSQ